MVNISMSVVLLYVMQFEMMSIARLILHGGFIRTRDLHDIIIEERVINNSKNSSRKFQKHKNSVRGI